MANKEEALGNNIIEAIATIAKDAVSKAGYDKTIKAQIISTDSADTGTYSCKYGGTTFIAVGTENAYKVNDTVMVSIPENNWDNPKVILNKLYSKEIEFKSLDPFSDFLDVNEGKPALVDVEEIGVKANILPWSERTFTLTDEYDFAKLYNEPYTRMGIEIALKTGELGSIQNVNAGTYGIRIKLFKDTNSLVPFIIYEFNSTQMFGNLYNFNDYIIQKLLVPITPEDMALVKSIQVSVFQNNDFTCYNTTTGQITPLVYPMPESDVQVNISARDLKLYFGYGKEEYHEGDVTLLLSNPAQYFEKWEDTENKKHFSWVYWYRDSMGQIKRSSEDNSSFPPAYFEYCINNKDWFSCFYNDNYTSPVPIEVSHGGGELDYLIGSDLIGSPEIKFRVRIQKENFDSQSALRYSNLYSNTITLYRYQPIITSEEIDASNAIQFSYEYQDRNIDDEDKIYTELRYNDMENQLYTQYEFLLPHCIHLDWSPRTADFQNPSYLAGATVTWKVPAFEYTETIKQKSLYEQASLRFNFESSTVFARPRAGYEYSSTNDTVRFETIEGITYMVWDVTLSDDFIYDLGQRNKKYYYGDTDQTNWSTMQALTLTFRPKEYFLPTMVNNTIYCTIKKENIIFEGKYEIPIANVRYSETGNKTFILTEDFEKPYLINKHTVPLDYEHTSVTATEEKLFHFCFYQNDQNGTLKKSGPLSLLRPLGGTATGQNIFDESLPGFYGFKSRTTQIGSNVMSDYYKLTGKVSRGLKYNFILKKVNDNVIRYYFYFFNIKPMDDNIDHSYLPALTSGNISKDFDPTEIYYMNVYPYETDDWLTGDRCIYENAIYKALEPQDREDTWDPTKWEECTLDTIVEDIGDGGKWVKLGAPNAQEASDRKNRDQTYHVKNTFTFTNSNNIKIKFQHYKTYVIEQEVVRPINTYTVNTEDNKEEYIEDNILSILSDYIVDGYTNFFKEGYWYYNDSHEFVQSDTVQNKEIKWYTLRCPSLDSDYYKFLALQSKTYGITSIKEIPIYFYRETWDSGYDDEGEFVHTLKEARIYLIEGINKLYCDASGVIREKNMGPGEAYFSQVGIHYPSTPISRIDLVNPLHPQDFLFDLIHINPSLISYEFSKADVFAPVVTKANEEDYFSHYILRFDNIGFTVNYKEIGEGNKYPAETLKECLANSGQSYAEDYYLPIVFQQRQLFRDDFNQWTGDEVQIGEDAIFSPVIGAGAKIGGMYNGLLMGAIGKIDQSVSRSVYGLYGYNNNVQSFGLKADGTMFLGKAGKGQLLLDGNSSTIQSANYETASDGMLIDFDDAKISMKHPFTKSGTTYNGYITLDAQNNIQPLKIGTNSSPNLSVEWDGTVHAKDIVIDGGTLSGALKTVEGGTTTIEKVTIKGSKIINDNGQSLEIDSDGYLNLSEAQGIKFGTGLEIKAVGDMLVTEKLLANYSLTTQRLTVSNGGTLVVFGHGLSFIEIEGHHVLGYN